ncbi:deoxyribonuclease V [Allostreptomyces psammosilenae]|uniref:Endonuclease V n=1 Tax=Allostreptomyces psammosilenae TaxID=1892865 RepID=A0A853A654_9ACTN|nr:deoxyribonuclease V [Allostreptomyces psammosilenae]NYI06018.1 deoxyribonuclease V [Allostreptomyces psammosilenae]
MRILQPHTRPADEAAARRIQDELRARAEPFGPGPERVRTIAGVDVAYAGAAGAADDQLAAAIVVLDAFTLEVVDSAVAVGRAEFPYVPGLFAFRELPTVLDALERLDTVPDLVLCDGHGVAHPRRFGLACHLGVLTGLPTAGVGKTRLVGEHAEPGAAPGDGADLVHEGEVVGRVLRTQRGVKPVYVSAGHRIGLDAACRHVLATAPRYRLPETTRQADALCRQALREAGTESGSPALS